MNWIIEDIAKGCDKIAVIFKEKEYSYNSLYCRIKEYFYKVKENLRSGDVVAVISDYSFESIALFFALYENKNIIVPITTKIEHEIEERIQESGCTKIIRINDGQLLMSTSHFNDDIHPLIFELREESKSGLILFSSGSTGKPKAMIHDLGNLIDTYRDKKSKKIVFLIFLMFDHIGGLNTLFNCISMNVTMVFPESRDPDHVAHLIEKYKVNILPASPTFLNLILISEANINYDLSSLRMITYGTEPMPESLLIKLKSAFPRVKFLQTFGTSETGISTTSSYSSTSTFLKIDDPNTEYKIIDNELWLRSKTQIMGYLNSSMERFTDGWFRTGDMVEEKDGYIKIVGRNTEIINVGGEKVLPSEVESVLFQMSGIEDCTVYGEKNPITGQIVVAKILYKDNDIKLSELKKKIVSFCSDKLARYKIPAKVLKMTETEYTERFKKKRI